MFTREALIEQAPDLLEGPKPLLEVLSFDPCDFRVPDSEETLYVCRGNKTDYKDAIHFWVKAIQSEDWTGRESILLRCITSAECMPISGERYTGLFVQCTFELIPLLPIELQNLPEPVAAMLMFDDCCDIAVIAEYPHMFVTLHWETTA